MTWAATGGPTGWAWLALTVTVLVLAGLSVGVYLRLFHGAGHRAGGHATARRQLDDQLARGQITEREYLHLTAALDEERPRHRPRGRRGSRST